MRRHDVDGRGGEERRKDAFLGMGWPKGSELGLSSLLLTIATLPLSLRPNDLPSNSLNFVLPSSALTQ